MSFKSWQAQAPRYSLGIALALILMWGANFSIQKYALNLIGPEGFLFARYALILPACCVLLMLFLHGFTWPKIDQTDWWPLFRIGFIGHAMHVGLVVWGIHLSTPFSSSLILAIGPIFTLLILRFSGQSAELTWQAVIGVSVALLGALIFMSDKLVNMVSVAASLGDLILIVAAFTFSLYTVKVRPINERLGIINVMVFSTLLVSLPMAVAVAPWGFSRIFGSHAWHVYWPAVSLALFYSVVISAFLGWLLWAWINVVRGAARSAPLMYLMPPVAGAISWLVYDEQFTSIKLAGAVIALLGVALAQFAGKRPIVETSVID